MSHRLRLDPLHSFSCPGSCSMALASPKAWVLHYNLILPSAIASPGLSLGTMIMLDGSKSQLVSMSSSVLELLLPLKLHPLPMTSCGLSQCQALDPLSDPFMPSVPVPPGSCIHTSKFSNHSFYAMTLKIISRMLPQKCWSLLNHRRFFSPT